MKHACGDSTLALAKIYFLTFLITQDIHAYPRVRNLQDLSSESDKLTDFPVQLHRPVLSLQRSPRSPRNTIKDESTVRSTQDEVGRLIESALENGELLNEEEWNNSHNGSNKNTQRDTMRYESTDTKILSRITQPRRTDGQPGRRRLFGDEGDSSSMELMQSDGGIVFPDDKIHKPTLRPPQSCKGSTFCENVPNYPEDLINTAIQRNTSLRYLESVDVAGDVVHRIDVPDDVPLCVSTEQVVFPKTAENKHKGWQFILNQENYKQGIRIETCSNENADCRVFEGLAEGYKTSCKQRYVYRQLAAIREDGSIQPDMFRFPSSCCCHVKFTGDPHTRMGIGLGLLRTQTTTASSRRRK